MFATVLPELSSAAKFKTSANASDVSIFNELPLAKDITESLFPRRAVGYARVSTYGQTLDAQLEQLKAAGCAKTYREQASGVRERRKARNSS